MHNKIFFIAVVLILCTIIVFWPRKSEHSYDIDNEQIIGRVNIGIDSGLNYGTFFETYQNKKRFLITSKKAELHRKDKYLFLTNVDGKFFSNEESGDIIFKSNYGRTWFEKDVLQLSNNVLIESPNSYKFTMETLEYNSQKHEISTKESIKIESKNYYSTGIGLIGYLDKGYFTLLKKVFAKKQIQKNNWLHVNAKSAEFYSNEKRTIFKNGVSTKLAKLDLTCDQFEVFERDNSEEFIAKGNVIMHIKDYKAQAERAFIRILEDKIILAGNAKVESKNDLIGGEEIVISNNADKIEVKKAYGRTEK